MADILDTARRVQEGDARLSPTLAELAAFALLVDEVTRAMLDEHRMEQTFHTVVEFRRRLSLPEVSWMHIGSQPL